MTRKPKSNHVPKLRPLHLVRKDLWQTCRGVVFRLHGNDCYSCPAKDLKGSNCQLGHFIPSVIGGPYLRYNIKNLRYQCYRCNISLKGNWPGFYTHMAADVGLEAIEELLALIPPPLQKGDKRFVPKRDFYLERIAELQAADAEGDEVAVRTI